MYREVIARHSPAHRTQCAPLRPGPSNGGTALALAFAAMEKRAFLAVLREVFRASLAASLAAGDTACGGQGAAQATCSTPQPDQDACLAEPVEGGTPTDAACVIYA